MADAKPIFIRPGECKTFFGFGKTTLYKWIAEGKITPFRHGPNATFIKVEQVEAVLASQSN